MGNAHYVKVCQFGKTHGQCRCPGPKRTIEVRCNVPHLHRQGQVIPFPSPAAPADEAIDYLLQDSASFDENEGHDFNEIDLSQRLDNLLTRELWWMRETLRDDLVTKIMAEVTN